jgi:hypothetical protein
MCIDEKWSTVISQAVPSLQNVKIHPRHPLKPVGQVGVNVENDTSNKYDVTSTV